MALVPVGAEVTQGSHVQKEPRDYFAVVREGIDPAHPTVFFDAVDHIEEEARHWKYDHQEASKELVARAERAEEQLEARQKLIDRFLEWDALNPPPEEMPAPFGDMHYWHSEFRRLESQAHRERHGYWRYGEGRLMPDETPVHNLDKEQEGA